MRSVQLRKRMGIAQMSMHDQFVDHAPISIILIDRSGHIVELNKNALRMFGWAYDDLVGQHVNVLMSNDPHAQYDAFLEPFHTNDQENSTTIDWDNVRSVRKTGEIFQSKISLTEIDRNGSVHVAVYVQKCSEMSVYDEIIHNSRATEQKLDVMNRQLWRAVNGIDYGFVLYDENDRLIVANNAARDLYAPIASMFKPGAPFEEIVRAGLERHVWQLNGRDPEQWLQSQLAKSRPGEGRETELILYDGRHVVCRDHRNGRGELATVIIDVTADRIREQELAQTKDELETIAYTDELTGLGTRKKFHVDYFDNINYVLEHKRFAAIHLDIDNFKRYNDTFGHAAGDLIIKEIGRRLKFISDEFPICRVYRWGGDEFIILVDRSEVIDIDLFCQEITDIMAIPLSIEGSAFHPTASLGVALYPEDGIDARLLISYADLALYKSKEIGRDAYSFFNSEMRTESERNSWVEKNVAASIEKGEIFVCYQPEIDANTGAVVGVEALIRWDHAELGIISPDHFLPAVEKTRHVESINRLVFDQAMKTARLWLDTGLEFGRMSVNLSPQHIKLGHAVEDLASAMERHGVAASHVGIEVVESVLLDDPTVNGEDFLGGLNNLGVHITLDDFGTGYASLSHLSDFPISGLKIDRSFIGAKDQVEKKREVIRTLVNLSRLIHIEVVCEGVETIEQFKFVKQCGNCAIQGYLFARPMKVDKATAWIERQEGVSIVDQLNESLYAEPDAAVS